jgi:NADH-quinone oxidoreductase subunit L
MPDHAQFMLILGYVAIAAPVLLACALGIPSLLGRPLSERLTARAVEVTVVTGLLASLGLLGLMLYTGERHVGVPLGNWVDIPLAEGEHYRFSVKFVFDRLSVPMALMSFVLCGTIGAFAVRYVHREPGYNRFFTLYSLFLLGMVLTSLAGTIETLFTGWELVGLSSALLVAFFQERPAPVRNGLWVWIVYRVSDAALLLAAVVLHHGTGGGDFDQLLGNASWPDGVAAIAPGQALVVGLLLLLAAAGKSALVPFSGWLPRAMEGPTPSSAVFYGALSVHLGAYLLLRASPLIAASGWLAAVIVTLGLVTALYASLVGGVQTDAKSALSFASLAQVGIIVAEVGMGWAWVGFNYVALIHLVGHACLRTLQFIRTPTILQDYRGMENDLGRRLPRPSGLLLIVAPPGVRSWLYRLALERGYLDSLLNDYVAGPFVRAFRLFDSLERRWTGLLSGSSDRTEPATPDQPMRKGA